MNRRSLVGALLVLLGALVSCTAPRSTYMNVVVRPRVEQAWKGRSILVFPFAEEAPESKGKGGLLARMAQQDLMERGCFPMVSLVSAGFWDRVGQGEEDQILAALEEGRRRGYDLVLLGRIRRFFPGGLIRTRVHLDVRIVDTQKEITLFWGKNGWEDEGPDPGLAMDPRLSRPAVSPERLAGKVLGDLLDQLR